MTPTSAGPASAASWITKPATRAAITGAARQFWAAQDRLHGDLGPLGDLDDVEARQLCHRLWSVGVAALFDDDGNRVPIDQAVNAAADMDDWLTAEMWQGLDAWTWAVAAARRLGQLATGVAETLGRAGLLPTPLRRGDLATIAFAILRADVIDWTEDPATIADRLQPVEPAEAARTGEGRILPGVRGETRRELDRWLIAVEDWAAGGPPPRAPYAGGKPRVPTPREVETANRRKAVAAVLARWPYVRAKAFCFEPGGRLSEQAETLQEAREDVGLPRLPTECFRSGPAARRFRKQLREDLAYWRPEQKRPEDAASIPAASDGGTVNPC